MTGGALHDATTAGAVKIHLVLDCADAQALAPFWAAALGKEIVWTFGQYVGIGPEPMLLLQQVDEPKTAKNRMHIDVYATDIEAKAGELVTLGATRIDAEAMTQGPARWIRMRDPEGNEFCVCRDA